MDTFNSKEFYGHSLGNDPKLRTTTRNYEFKYNSSDHLEKVISQVRMNRDMKKEKEFLTRTRVLPSIAKLLAPYPSQEMIPEIKMPKVETHIGRSTSRETIVKVMSDADIHAMVSRALLSNPGLAPITEPPETSSLREMSSEEILEIEPKVIFSPRKPEIKRKTAIYCAENESTMQPKWVEIEPNQKAFSNMTLVAKDTTESQSDDSLSMPDDNESTDLVDDDEPNEANQNRIWDAFSFDSKLSDDLVIRNDPDEKSYTRDEKTPPNSVLSFGVESQLNDSENAEMERILGKTQFQKWQLPHVPEIDFDHLNYRDESETSDFEDAQEPSSEKNQDEVESSKDHIQPLMSVTTTAQRSTKRNSPTKKSPRSKAGTEKSTKNTSRSIRSSASPFAPKEPTALSPSDRQMRKQIESLKQEKMRIFCKMTSIHEKSIEMLDRLRHSFTELTLPDGLAERKTRERNAFEFSVRFSRNYLFPLGRMIDELKATPAEYFNSAVTNEPCVKVCGIYGLLSQALQCYHKQLRHFFTENTPKKLDILLSMIVESSHLCFEKEIFDKRDTVIQCLLLRCNIFLEFLTKFSKDQQSARREIESPRSARWDQARLSKTSSKWDLTMNLNNLNMYEPTVVPKPAKKSEKKTSVRKEKKEKKEKKTGQSQSSRITLKSRESAKTRRDNEPIVLPAPDPIDTQVQKQLPSSEGDNDLTKTVIETLQDITKDEVRQMLGPIVLNLDSILKSQDNPQTVDSMLSVLKSQLLSKCKVDTAATENSTQNGNTYQKEVTKKRVNSNTSVAHNMESKDTRRRKSKVNTPKSRNSSRTNVKKGSTERTEKRISRGGRMDTMRDKQSLTNDDSVADDYEQQQRTRSRSAVSGDGIPSVEVAKTLPTLPGREPAAIQIGNGIPPPSLAILPSPLPVQLDEVMPLPQPIQMPAPPPPPPIASAPNYRLTSQQQRLEKSIIEPETMIFLEDKSAPESDGGWLNGQQWMGTDTQGQQTRDGAVNEEARRINSPSSQTKLTGATPLTGQIKQLKYCRNAQYTFIRYNEEEFSAEQAYEPPAQNEYVPCHYPNENDNDYIPDKEYFTESCTKLASLSAKSSQNLSFKSLQNSVPNLIPNPPVRMGEQRKNAEDLKSFLEERASFVECCENDPFYNNPQFPEPWKVFSKISQNIATDILGNFVSDLSFGEESYVRDFINMETKT